MAIEKALPALRFVGGKLVQAIKGTPKVTKAPTTTAASTTISRMPTPAPMVTPTVKPILRRTPAETPLPGVRITQKMVKSGAVTPEEYALNRAILEAERQARRTAAVRTAAQAGDEVVATAPRAVDNVVEAATRSRFRPTTRGTLETVGSLAPLGVAGVEAAGIDVPTPLEYAALAGGVGGGASLAARGLGKSGFANAAVRAAYGQKGALGKIGNVVTKGVFPALGALQVQQFGGDILNKLSGGGEPAVADQTMLPETQILNPEDVFGAEETIDTSGMTQEDLYFNEVYKALDVMTQNAQAQASQAMADIDAEYENEMKAIDADYKSRQQQISNIYSEALNQIDDYTAQANQLLRETAEASQAGYEAAAGGMQNLQAPTGLTAEEAALSGVSPTALGGGAITNAALTRSLAGAAQAAAAAQRFATGVDLGGEAAATRGIQADTLAALERSLLETQTSARRAAATDRQSIREQEAAAKAAASTLESDARLKVAEMVGTMTPEQLAAWRGSSASKKKFNAPSWYGKFVNQPDETPVKLALSEFPATVGTVNTVLDSLYANLNSAAGRNPATALNFWQEYFDTLTPDARKVLAFRGLPTTGGKMYAELFPTTPSK